MPKVDLTDCERKALCRLLREVLPCLESNIYSSIVKQILEDLSTGAINKDCVNQDAATYHLLKGIYDKLKENED